jgi:hypothetical protein
VTRLFYGTFGQSVKLAVKLDSTLKTDDLCFYSYDKAANTYKKIVPSVLSRRCQWLSTAMGTSDVKVASIGAVFFRHAARFIYDRHQMFPFRGGFME